MVEELHEPLDNGQSESQPFSAVSLRVLELTELLKNLPMLVLGNPSSGIPHLNSHGLCAASGAKNDAAPVGITNCVGNQVAHDAIEQYGIASYEERVACYRKCEIFLARCGLVLDPDSLHEWA